MHSIEKTISVSIVIPTYNAGAQFKWLLEALQCQKRIDQYEIIIIDSGSTDETLQLARKYGIQIEQITQEQFSHSYARNIGAEKAQYKYLLFMVQDAMPEDEYWIYNMVKPLLESSNKIAAVTCIEKPQQNASLFARMAIIQQMKWLDVVNKNRIMKMPDFTNEGETYEQAMRKNCALNDVSCVYEKEIFLKYKYRYDYAEDLDMGKRLIEDGYKLVLLGTVRVVHSHSRNSMYYLKRMVVERVSFSKIFREYDRYTLTEEQFITGTLWLYEKLSGWVNEIARTPLVYSKFAFLSAIKEACTLEGSFFPMGEMKIEPCSDLKQLIEALRKISEELPQRAKADNAKEIFYGFYETKLGGMIDYLWGHESEELSLLMLVEICEAMYCMFGNVIGTLFGDVVVNTKQLIYLDGIYDLLKKGV